MGRHPHVVPLLRVPPLRRRPMTAPEYCGCGNAIRQGNEASTVVGLRPHFFGGKRCPFVRSDECSRCGDALPAHHPACGRVSQVIGGRL